MNDKSLDPVKSFEKNIMAAQNGNPIVDAAKIAITQLRSILYRDGQPTQEYWEAVKDILTRCEKQLHESK